MFEKPPRLITFDRVEERMGMDLLGQVIDLELPDDILLRGHITGARWWSHYPRQFNWNRAVQWGQTRRGWRRAMTRQGGMDFPFEAIEFFRGPFELASGELFFEYKEVNIHNPHFGVSRITLYPEHSPVPNSPDTRWRQELLKQAFAPKPRE